ncbi:MAG: hypothetical protein ACO2ZA_07670 [Litorivicinaceae bacterium]
MQTMRYDFDVYLKLVEILTLALNQIRELDDAKSIELLAEVESDLMEAQSKLNKARFSIANDHSND